MSAHKQRNPIHRISWYYREPMAFVKKNLRRRAQNGYIAPGKPGAMCRPSSDAIRFDKTSLHDQTRPEELLMTAPTYEKLTPPSQGTRVTVDANGRWKIP